MTISALPTHLWEFNNTGNDLVGSMHHTLLGTTTASGKPVYALDDQQSIAYRNVAYNLGAGAWSVANWMKTEPTSTDFQSCVLIGDITLGVSPSADTVSVYRVTNGATLNLSGSATISVNTWYFLAATRSSGGVVKLYLNGSLVATGSCSTFNDDNGGSQFGEFNGYAALTGQVAVYEGEWTADDIAYIYNAGSGVAYPWEVPPVAANGSLRNHFYL